MVKKWREIVVVSLVLLVLALVSTYPLIQYFDTGIPYSPFGGAKVWNRSGDQIQLMYWFWLVKENVLGHIPFDSNPFEFNMVEPYVTSGLNTIPFAFISMLFSPFGDITAYNSTIISSYVLTGLFMYLLLRLYFGSRTGALVGALVFTFAPSRIRGFTAGHSYGFLYFCYPFILYYLEKGMGVKKIRYGLVSAAGLIFLAMVEPHLIYYFCVFLGVFIPVRMISFVPGELNGNSGKTGFATGISVPLILGAGGAVTLYVQEYFSRKEQLYFFSDNFWWIIVLYPLLFVIVSLFSAALYQRLGGLDFRKCMEIEAKSIILLYLFLPLAGFVKFGLLPENDFLVWAAIMLVLVVKVWLLRNHLLTMAATLRRTVLIERAKFYVVVPVLLAMAAIVYWMASAKVKQVAATVVGGGRTLEDVGLFSAHLLDLFSSISNVYIGIIPGLLFGGCLLWFIVVGWLGAKNRYEQETDFLVLFYMVITFCSLILALGLAFGEVSLYAFFFHYFPFFNYPRVSDRIITLALFCLAIVCAYGVNKIVKNCRGRWFVALLFIIAMGWQLKDYNILKPMGINIIDRGQDIYSYVKKNIGDGRLLEIPLWPGDSHQSSLYQHYIMLDRVPRINGCSPMVLKKYIDTVFSPLASINQGRLDGEQFKLLHKLRVKFLTVHKNRDVFVKKISPFSPMATVRRLANSPYLELLPIDNSMHFKTWSGRSKRLFLFRVRELDEVGENVGQSWYDMPWFYDATWQLPRQTGKVVKDVTIGRDVLQANEGEDKAGFLVYGPYDVYSPGDYLCSFFLAAAGEVDSRIVRLEVSQALPEGDVKILKNSMILGSGQDSGYRIVTLPYTLKKDTKLEFRAFYYGRGRVRLEKISVSKAGSLAPLYLMEAEKMVGDTGDVTVVQDASGGKAIQAIRGRNPSAVLVYGPNRQYGAGRYRARFYFKGLTFARAENGDDAVVELSVTDGLGKIEFARLRVKDSQLNYDYFSAIDLEFELPRCIELSFRVGFTGRGGVQLDKIEVSPKR